VAQAWRAPPEIRRDPVAQGAKRQIYMRSVGHIFAASVQEKLAGWP